MQAGFIKRFIIIFIPLIIFMILIKLAGIDNMVMMIILELAFVWMVQAIYKKVSEKKKKES